MSILKDSSACLWVELATVESAWQLFEDLTLVSKTDIPRMTCTQEPVDQRVVGLHLGVCTLNRLGCVVEARRWSASKCVASRWSAAHVDRFLTVFCTALEAFIAIVDNSIPVVDQIGRSLLARTQTLRVEGRSLSRLVHVVRLCIGIEEALTATARAEGR